MEGVIRIRWGRWKSQHRKIVPLSLFRNVNSKVIKVFVPELRSRKCFSCFGIPMFYVYSMYISHIHVRLCYTVSANRNQSVIYSLDLICK